MSLLRTVRKKSLSGHPALTSLNPSWASPPPLRSSVLRGFWRVVLPGSSTVQSHPLLFSSAVGPFTKPALISWLEAREPWGLNVQGVQFKGNPGAAPAGEFQRNDQVLLLSHLLFCFLRSFTLRKSWETLLFARRKSLSSIANKCWVLGLLPSRVASYMLVFSLAPHPEALSGAALAHGTASLSSCPFTDAPPQPCTALPFLLLARLIPLLLLFFV